MKTVSLLGTGWLGLPLGQALTAKGHTVHAATTQDTRLPELAQAGLIPHLIHIQPDLDETAAITPPTATDPNTHLFWESDVLIVTLPFKRNFADPFLYVRQIKAVMAHCHSQQNILFTSATSIYPDCDHPVDENLAFSPIGARLQALASAEAVIMGTPESRKRRAILRLGGLYGPNREIQNFAERGLAQRRLTNVVNLIHRDDVIAIIAKMITNNLGWGEILNAVSDVHPTRAQLYGQPPEALSSRCGKTVSNQKLKMVLNYHFCYPSPL